MRWRGWKYGIYIQKAKTVRFPPHPGPSDPPTPSLLRKEQGKAFPEASPPRGEAVADRRLMRGKNKLTILIAVKIYVQTHGFSMIQHYFQIPQSPHPPLARSPFPTKGKALFNSPLGAGYNVRTACEPSIRAVNFNTAPIPYKKAD